MDNNEAHLHLNFKKAGLAKHSSFFRDIYFLLQMIHLNLLNVNNAISH